VSTCSVIGRAYTARQQSADDRPALLTAAERSRDEPYVVAHPDDFSSPRDRAPIDHEEPLEAGHKQMRQAGGIFAFTYKRGLGAAMVGWTGFVHQLMGDYGVGT
jgi:hypothetical protein